MSEQQFGWNYFENEVVIRDKQDKKRMIVLVFSNFMCIPYNRKSFDEIVDLLNEQQELIEELHISDHMGWGRAEKFEKELKTKKIYIKRLEYKVQKFKEMNKELKFQLDECTNNKLYSRRELEKENEQLKADEQLYAKEILRLKEELKQREMLKLGGDY